MSIQSLIMSNRKLTRLFMSGMTPAFWQRQGRKFALKTFAAVSSRSPAYREFIRRNKISPKSIKTISDFHKLPIIDKKNYISKYKITDLVFDARLDDKYTIERSSGHSGSGFFWPRLNKEDELFPKYIEYSFVQFYGIDKLRTLVILTLALGTWTSGEKMAEALRLAARKSKYKLTVITPGGNKEEVIEIVKKLAGHYDQTVIVGYPPFVKSVIDQGIGEKINWKKLNTKLGLGGEGYSEIWRQHMSQKIGLSKNDLLGISGGYGAADVGMSIGREYPITVLIRKLALKDKGLFKALFGEHSVMPSLLQYNPGAFYIETTDQGELLFTAQSGIPLVRYNIHDRGGIISFEKMINILEKYGYNCYGLLAKYGYGKGDVWRLPFFYVFGRSDGTITVAGANVYPENLDSALCSKETETVSGCKLALETDQNLNAKFVILVELSQNTRSLTESDTVVLGSKLHDLFLEKILKTNHDFRYVNHVDPVLTDPVVRIYPHGQGPFDDDRDRIKRRYII